MRKVLVFSTIFFVFMLFASSFVFASEIDMNLANSDETDYTVYGSSSNHADDTNTASPTLNSNLSTSLPGSTSAISESSLTLSNILNIILIVLGILLVLFAIAILLRIH